MGYIMDLRSYIGHRPVLMPSACVLIFNDRGQLLLQKRRDNGLWGYPGGSMELGETTQECAVREAYEETGLKCRNLELFDIFSGEDMHYIYPNGDEVYVVETLYICRDFEGELRVQESEATRQKFFDLDHLPEAITPLNRRPLQRLLAALPSKGGRRSVRRANEADREAMGRIYCETWKRAYAHILKSDYLAALTRQNCMPDSVDPDCALVAEDGDGIIGLVTFGPARDADMKEWGEIRAIYVLPDCWRRGVGERLFSAASEAIRRLNYEKFYLWVLTENLRARRFYEKMGMRSSDRMRLIEIGSQTVQETRYDFGNVGRPAASGEARN